MKSAMKVLKEQALAISVSAQKDAAAAREEREKVEAQLAAVSKQLAVRARGGAGERGRAWGGAWRRGVAKGRGEGGR